MKVDELCDIVSREASQVDFAPEFYHFQVDGVAKARMLTAEGFYFRCLAAIAKVKNVQHALELGTFFGTSAVALGKYAKKVTTCDVNWKPLMKRFFSHLAELGPGEPIPHFDGGLQAIRFEDGGDSTRQDWSKYDFIFIDIGTHEGQLERQIHESLNATGWRGFAFYDDINWEGMKPLWESIENDKMATDWHARAGFGVVKYGIHELEDYFDDVVCITLDKRLQADGEPKIIQDLSPYGKVRKLLVGDGELYDRSSYFYLDVDMKPRRQAYNYGRCLLNVIENAKTAGHRNLLYLEDDARITDKFHYVFPQAWEQAKRFEWDVLFIGGNHTNANREQVAEYLIKPQYSLDLHAVVFNHTSFDKILAIKPRADETIDGMIGDRQQKGELKVVALTPSVIIQKPNFSYNENRFIDKTANYIV